MKKYIASFDFDGTLRVDNMEKECIDLLNSLPSNIISVINTGRGIGILQDKIKHFFPDTFDIFINSIKYFICNNGTDIYYKSDNDFDILKDWFEHLKDQWDRELLLFIDCKKPEKEKEIKIPLSSVDLAEDGIDCSSLYKKGEPASKKTSLVFLVPAESDDNIISILLWSQSSLFRTIEEEEKNAVYENIIYTISDSHISKYPGGEKNKKIFRYLKISSEGIFLY